MPGRAVKTQQSPTSEEVQIRADVDFIDYSCAFAAVYK